MGFKESYSLAREYSENLTQLAIAIAERKTDSLTEVLSPAVTGNTEIQMWQLARHFLLRNNDLSVLSQSFVSFWEHPPIDLPNEVSASMSFVKSKLKPMAEHIGGFGAIEENNQHRLSGVVDVSDCYDMFMAIDDYESLSAMLSNDNSNQVRGIQFKERLGNVCARLPGEEKDYLFTCLAAHLHNNMRSSIYKPAPNGILESFVAEWAEKRHAQCAHVDYVDSGSHAESFGKRICMWGLESDYSTFVDELVHATKYPKGPFFSAINFLPDPTGELNIISGHGNIFAFASDQKGRGPYTLVATLGKVVRHLRRYPASSVCLFTDSWNPKAVARLSSAGLWTLGGKVRFSAFLVSEGKGNIGISLFRIA